MIYTEGGAPTTPYPTLQWSVGGALGERWGLFHANEDSAADEKAEEFRHKK